MFPAKKRSYCVLISHETFVLDSMVPVKGKNYKITPDEWATAGESVHGRQKFSLNWKIFTKDIDHGFSLIFCSDCLAQPL